MKKSEDDREHWARSLGMFGVIVSELLGFTGAGVGIGYWTWSHWGAPWWVVLLLAVSGLSMAMYRLYVLSQKNL